MTVKTFQQTDYQSQTVEDYEQTIDDNFAVLAGPAGAFAAHEQSTPDMTARVDAGMIAKGDGSVIEAAAQNTGTITAPSSDPRNDIVYLDLDDGTVGVVTGTEAATPADPEFPLGAMPLARINLTTSTTSITNAIVDDCRPGGGQPDRFEQLKHVEKTSNADIKRNNAGELFVANSASAITFSLDPAAQLGPDFVFWVKNVGTGQLTVLPDGSETIDGDANLLLDQTEAALICRAGSNFRSLKIGENAGTGTVTSVATGTGLTGGPITTSGTISVSDGGIDTLQLADDAVTADKIAANAVDSSEIATDAVGSDEIAAGAVGASELSAGAITGQTAETTVDGANDEVLLHDNSATALRKVKVDDLVSGGGGSGGKIGQVVSTTKTATFNSTSTTYVDITGLSATITPTATSSKVLILFDVDIAGDGDDHNPTIQLVRGSTAIAIGDAAGNRARGTKQGGPSSPQNAVSSQAGNYLDSPSTTSATTYKIQAQGNVVASGATWRVNADVGDGDVANRSRTVSTITLMEVLA